MNMDTIKEIDVKSVMTKSSLPVGGYSVNPYVGCPHACRYCYASFMKRFTGHTEPWGTFLDVKNWKPITNPHKYDGERVVIGSVTDGYNPYEEEFHRTRRLLEELRGSDAEIMICTADYGRRKNDSGIAGTIYQTNTMNMDTIKEIDVKSVMTKSSLPVGGYSVNPYVGCPHACRYCYASFMKRFTGHTEPWGTFLDVKNWKPITNPHKYDGERVVIGSVTDGYNPYEEEFHRTRRLLEELRGSDAEIMICTKSDLVLRDLDLLKSFPKVTVSWSVNTLDEQFCADMDNAVSIERRLKAMRQTYEAGIRTVCFVSPIFPRITDVKAIIEEVKDYADLIWLENLNLRGQFKGGIMTYIREKYPDLIPLYEEIYNKKRLEYWQALEQDISNYAKEQGFPYRINDLPYGRSEKGKPVIVNYFYHEKIRLTK